MQQAAIGLDVHLRALVESPDSATGQVVPDVVVGPADDEAALQQLVSGTEVLTVEHEHVPQTLLQSLAADGLPVRPGAAALRHAQDKIVMRRALHDMAAPCPSWREVGNATELAAFGEATGWPLVVKTARGGYDGKGVRIVSSPQGAEDWLARLAPGDSLLAEAHMPFIRELAVLLARCPSGEVRCWPVVETVQHGGVCTEALVPAPQLDPELALKAQRIATRIAEELDVTGVLAVEMFELPPDTVAQGSGRLAVNELAMRPHNSGHWTIDGAATSQFAQHLRAVLDLPLGPSEAVTPASVMVNLLGSDVADPSHMLERVYETYPEVHVHLYGKTARPGRKLGHVTVNGSDWRRARDVARAAVALLRGG